MSEERKVRIEGVVLRKEDHTDPDFSNADIEIPEDVPLLVNFDQDSEIGRARVWPDASGNLLFEAEVPESSLRHFAVPGFRVIEEHISPEEPRVIEKAELFSISFTNYPADPNLPPYTIKEADS